MSMGPIIPGGTPSSGFAQGTTGAAGQSGTSNSGATPTEQNFLTLLGAELQYQDPSNPVNSTQFIAELAQFSTLSGINAMQTTLKSILQAVQGGTNPLLSASALLGKQVTTAKGSGTVTSVSMPSGQTGAVQLDVKGLGTVNLSELTGIAS